MYIYIIYLYLQSGEGKEKQGRETSICGCLSDAPPPRTLPTTQAYALSGNRTDNPLVRRLALSPLSHTSLSCN